MISGLLALACLVTGKHTVATADSPFRLRAPHLPCYRSGMKDFRNSPSLAFLGQNRLNCLTDTCEFLLGTLL
jgi:hypothetical protein